MSHAPLSAFQRAGCKCTVTSCRRTTFLKHINNLQLLGSRRCKKTSSTLVRSRRETKTDSVGNQPRSSDDTPAQSSSDSSGSSQQAGDIATLAAKLAAEVVASPIFYLVAGACGALVTSHMGYFIDHCFMHRGTKPPSKRPQCGFVKINAYLGYPISFQWHCHTNQPLDTNIIIICAGSCSRKLKPNDSK